MRRSCARRAASCASDPEGEPMSDVVTYELAGDQVAWLTINRPEARNALSQAVRDGLWAGFRRFADDESGPGVGGGGGGGGGGWGGDRRRREGVLRGWGSQGDVRDGADDPTARLPALPAAFGQDRQ